ncbi:hypothetical protein V5O48_016822 [Marasmius crinis-equi]|uniref:C2H2-type domain-containing protein n=1 Tax=Marasmius crinis-equi TaxID=585013 RepID=A0ABR3EQS3_9AGAR
MAYIHSDQGRQRRTQRPYPSLSDGDLTLDADFVLSVDIPHFLDTGHHQVYPPLTVPWPSPSPASSTGPATPQHLSGDDGWIQRQPHTSQQPVRIAGTPSCHTDFPAFPGQANVISSPQRYSFSTTGEFNADDRTLKQAPHDQLGTSNGLPMILVAESHLHTSDGHNLPEDHATLEQQWYSRMTASPGTESSYDHSPVADQFPDNFKVYELRGMMSMTPSYAVSTDGQLSTTVVSHYPMGPPFPSGGQAVAYHPTAFPPDGGLVGVAGYPPRFPMDDTVASPSVIEASKRRRKVAAKYRCTSCSQTFTAIHGLANHEKVHKGIKDFICEYCSRGFTTKHTCKRHTTTCRLKQ